MVHKLEAVDTHSIYVIRPKWYERLQPIVPGVFVYRSQQTIVELDEQGTSYELHQELHLTFNEGNEYLFNLWLQAPQEDIPIYHESNLDLLLNFNLFKERFLQELATQGIKFFDVESIACGDTYIAIKLNSRSYRCPSQ